MLTRADWTMVSGLVHGFLDRAESRDGDWAGSLATIGVALPVQTPRQVHGVAVARAPFAGERPLADAVVTTDPQLAVGIVTADCVPILLVDRHRRVAVAVHAGWRGAAGGILDRAVDYLTCEHANQGARLEAAIGPAIGGCCYEVGDEVYDAFRSAYGPLTAAAWSRPGAKWHLDLRLAVRLLLAQAGVEHVETLGPCTRCDIRYHSYRRDGAGAGRQLSFVGWR